MPAPDGRFPTARSPHASPKFRERASWMKSVRGRSPP